MQIILTLTNREREMKIIRKIVIEIYDKEINTSKNIKSNIAIIRDGQETPVFFDCQVDRPTAHCVGRGHNKLIGKQSQRLAQLLQDEINKQ